MNLYGINEQSDATVKSLRKLTVLYSSLPKTKGCENCESVNGKDDLHFCCKLHSPSMYYVEFLAAWKHYKETHNKQEQTELVLRAIRNYLDNRLNKGCIFYLNGCTIYSKRPLVCYTYGLIPKEDWDKRYQSLKEKYGEAFNARPNQCNLVSTQDGREITSKQMTKWFQKTKEFEDEIGVPEQAINRHDDDGGSYRTFHDHLLVELFSLEFMKFLTQVRLTNPSLEEIDKTVELMREKMNNAA